MTPAPPSLHELFEFVPDGNSRPPDGPGMYTWMGRRAASRENLARFLRPTLPDGRRASVILFPEDVPEALVAAVLEQVQAALPAQDAVAPPSLGHYFTGQWQQGAHDWSARSFGIALSLDDETRLFDAARQALAIAGCDYLLLRSAARDAVCLVSALADDDARNESRHRWRWPFSRAAGDWQSGKRPAAPQPAVRSYRVCVVDAFSGDVTQLQWVCRHAHWQQLVRVFRAICPSLTGEHERALTIRSGAPLQGRRAVELLLALRSLLQRRGDAGLSIPVAGATFIPDNEPWFWPALVQVYELLCRGDGIEVQ